MVFQTGSYLALRGVQGCFSLHIAIWLCCGCGHWYNREAIGVLSVLMIRPKCWQRRLKVNHLTVIAAWECVLLDVICRNGSWALGTWIPWRLCVITFCKLQLASNNTHLQTASHNTRHNLQIITLFSRPQDMLSSWKYCRKFSCFSWPKQDNNIFSLYFPSIKFWCVLLSGEYSIFKMFSNQYFNLFCRVWFNGVSQVSIKDTNCIVNSCQQKSISLKFSKSQTGSDVRYSCHHNSSCFTFPIFAHSCCFSVLHSLQSIKPRIY